MVWLVLTLPLYFICGIFLVYFFSHLSHRSHNWFRDGFITQACQVTLKSNISVDTMGKGWCLANKIAKLVGYNKLRAVAGHLVTARVVLSWGWSKYIAKQIILRNREILILGDFICEPGSSCVWVNLNWISATNKRNTHKPDSMP
jgi:hypothetical protein